MPYLYDSCMCEGGNCPLKNSCLRYLAKVAGRQDFFGSPPYTTDGVCEYYWRTANIRVGNQTAFCTRDIWEPFDFAIHSDFDAFEWFPDKRKDQGWEMGDFTPELREKIVDYAWSEKIVLSVHSAGSPALPEPRGVENLEQAIGLAKDLHARNVVVHLDLRSGLHKFAEVLVSSLSGMRFIAPIKIAIENTTETGPQDFNRLFEILRKAPSSVASSLGMCFDLGHANLFRTTRNDYISYLTQLDPAIPLIHLHLHENYGDKDEHLPIFTGPSGENDQGIRQLIRILKARKFEGMVILEQWPDPPSQLLESRRRFLDLWMEEAEGGF